MDEISHGMLTESMIRAAVGGGQKLQEVTRLALVVDSSEISVEGVWAAVPRLHTLTLDGSRLLSFRDLGVGLRHLNTLSLESSGVEDLDGISALSGLRELRLPHNRISDVTPLACHGNLQVLGLRDNRVGDINALDILSTLPLLYSLDLRQNPLTQSLAKLLDGRDRGVVHHLIPQIRILDGAHLSGERTTVGSETLDEAIELICEGSSGARAAWAEEDAAAAAADGSATVMEGQRGGGGDDSLPRQRPSRRRRSQEGGVVALGDATRCQSRCQSPAGLGIVHWDSDLTQGGGQAFSGNPSSAIRRHKLGIGVGKRRTDHSPARVLETLDLAKMMERGSKPRHTQVADRVSEWRKETCSDSMPLQDPNVPPEGFASPALDSYLLYSPSKQKPLGDKRNGRSVSPVRDGRRVAHEPVSEWANSATVEGGNGGPSDRAVWASSSVRVARETARNMLLDGSNVSGRPWTTGDFVTSVGGLPQATSPRGVKNRDAVPDEKGAAPGEARKACRRRQRPQTATVPGRPNDPEQTPTNASWQFVWESLQSARLVSPRAEAGTGDLTQGLTGRVDGLNRLGSVDFRGQRRARQAVTTPGRFGGGKGGGGGDGGGDIESDTVSAGDAESSDGSEGVDDRDQIKGRASDFTCGAAASSVAGRPSRYHTSFSGAPTGNDYDGKTNNIVLKPQTCIERSPSKVQRNTATKEPNRSLAVTDDHGSTSTSTRSTSSREEETHDKPHPAGRDPAHGSGACAVDDDDDGGSCASVCGEGGGWNAARGVSSIRASQKLGFDLRKSLAAIDRWTDKAATAKDGCSTPRQGDAAARQPTSIFVEETTRAGFPFPASTKPAERRAVDGFQSATAEGSVCGPNQVDSDLPQNSGSDDDGSEGEAVLSVAAARAALGISKAPPRNTLTAGKYPTVSASFGAEAAIATPSTVSGSGVRCPSRADIDAIVNGGHIGGRKGGKTKTGGTRRTARRRSSTLLMSAESGLAVGMSDEALEGMLRRQPRTVPELRTKESFREFFQGMGAERMGRLLRGAYQGALPADEVDRKVEKRLELVGDVLAW